MFAKIPLEARLTPVLIATPFTAYAVQYCLMNVKNLVKNAVNSWLFESIKREEISPFNSKSVEISHSFPVHGLDIMWSYVGGI